jgi:hypothetical protein
MSRPRTQDEQKLLDSLKRDVAKLNEQGLQMIHELESLDPVDDEKTEVSRPPAPVVELKREACPNLIKCLEGLLEAAKAGEMVGITFLCNKGHSTVVYYAGTRDFGAELAVFEDYKFRMLVDRNIDNAPKMRDQ